MRMLKRPQPINGIKELHFYGDYSCRQHEGYANRLIKTFPNVSNMKITIQGLDSIVSIRHICTKFSQLTKLTVDGEQYEGNHFENIGNVEELHYVNTVAFSPSSENRVKRLILDNVDVRRFLCVKVSFPQLKYLEIRSRRKTSEIISEHIAEIRRKFQNCVVHFVRIYDGYSVP